MVGETPFQPHPVKMITNSMTPLHISATVISNPHLVYQFLISTMTLEALTPHL